MTSVSIYDIIDLLNKELTNLFSSCNISNNKIFGIAETVFIAGNISVPEIDEKNIGIDDVYDLIVYHKLAGLNSSIDAAAAFGRRSGLIINEYSLGMVVFLDKKKTGLYPDQLTQYIQGNFPDQLKMQPYQSIQTRFDGAILDSRQVFTQEYNSNDQFKLKSNQYLFRINYTITAKFDKTCLKSCA